MWKKYVEERKLYEENNELRVSKGGIIFLANKPKLFH